MVLNVTGMSIPSNLIKGGYNLKQFLYHHNPIERSSIHFKLTSMHSVSYSRFQIRWYWSSRYNNFRSKANHQQPYYQHNHNGVSLLAR